MKDDVILALNKELMEQVLDDLNKSSPIYKFSHLASRDGHGAVGNQYGIYHDSGDWLINVSTDATNKSSSFAVELSIKDKNDRHIYNKLIAFANDCAQKDQLGPGNNIKSENDDSQILKNYNGSTKLSEIGENGPYIRLAKYRKVRAKSTKEVISMVNDCFIVVSLLKALKDKAGSFRDI
jgi:hypothetical protein